MDKKKALCREQIDIRLTLRLPEELERRIRSEAQHKGTPMNQIMLFILHKGIDIA